MLRANNVQVMKVMHVHESNRQEIETVTQDIVVPLRHPRKVAESWAKRKERTENFLELWQYTETLSRRQDVLFFDLEAKNLQALSNFVGRDLNTDWKPENHYPDPSPIQIEENDIDQATGIYERLSRG